MAAALLLALGLSLPGGATPLAERTWHQATTDSFVITGDGGERDTRRMAEHFATIHGVFRTVFPSLVPDDGVRVPVLGVDGQRRMRRFLGDRAKSTIGALRSGNLRREILIRSDLVGQEAFTTVYHEYLHLVLRRSAPHLPVWLNEGLAEVWSDLDAANPERTRVGRPLREHLEVLRSRSLLPMEEFLSVDHLSERYQKPALRRVFYAQSWALAHFLMISGEGRHAESLRQYIAVTGSGVGPVTAAERLFGDLDELEERLRKYVGGLTLPYLVLDLPPLIVEEIEVRRLSEAEALATLAEFLLYQEERDVVREMFDSALKSAPALAAAHQGLGLLDLYEDDHVAAAERFARALGSDPNLWLSHYGRAISLGRSASASKTTDDIEEHLTRATRLNPAAAPAFCRLGVLLGRKPDFKQAGLAMVRKAVAIEPRVMKYRLAEVSLLESAGPEGAAAQALERLLERGRSSSSSSMNNDLCWYGALAGFAAGVLPACDLACSLEPEGLHPRDSRGLARALAGNLKGAIEDFRVVLRSNEQRSESFLRARTDWLRELEAGRSPFTAEVLEEIRRRYLPWDC